MINSPSKRQLIQAIGLSVAALMAPLAYAEPAAAIKPVSVEISPIRAPLF